MFAISLQKITMMLLERWVIVFFVFFFLFFLPCATSYRFTRKKNEVKQKTTKLLCKNNVQENNFCTKIRIISFKWSRNRKKTIRKEKSEFLSRFSDHLENFPFLCAYFSRLPFPSVSFPWKFDEDVSS